VSCAVASCLLVNENGEVLVGLEGRHGDGERRREGIHE